MRYLIRLGFKNIFRQRTRAALALAAIAISVVFIVGGITLARGVEKQIFLELVGESGEVVIARQDYFDKSRLNPLKYSVPDSTGLKEKLLQVDGVKSVAQRIDFGVLVQSGENNKAIRATAVDVDVFGQRSSIPRSIVAGSYLQRGQKAILLGKTVADDLGLKPGDKVTLLGKDRYDSFSADDFELAGVFDLGNKTSNRAVYLPVSAAQEFLAMEDGVSKLVLYGADYAGAMALAARIRASGVLPEGTALRTWQDDTFLLSIHKTLLGVRKGISFIICFVAGLGILNMMMVSVLERRREVGVLMALGLSRRGIVASFLYEASLYGALGSVIGLVFAVPLGWYLHTVGLTVATDKVKGLPIAISVLRGDFTADAVVTGMVLGVLLGILGMVVPVMKTLSMTPQDAMTKG
ncbi:ABC transporter permease [Stigmatella sp. ncwal1]|uniref:ABC transporter permease n=1 Tax=Stigmatella ashevillensis TaxID=2995309 RepID=A0ABT5D6S4_9BACT|nr:FtsX-like permease family protein [Stigmatella ashevillena]MDC0708558.1 ABC transporter permease [Stigmatella ashevillena]